MAIPTRILVAAFAIVIASAVVARGIGSLVSHVGHAPHGMPRLRRIVDQVPRVVDRDAPTVLLIGSSVTAWGLDPDVIDKELHATTFNLGLAAAFLYEEAQVMQWLEREYAGARTPPISIVIELSPHLLFAKTNPGRQDMFAVLLDSPRELLARVWKQPEQGFRQLGRRYALGGTSGLETTFRLRSWLDDDLPRWFDELSEIDRQDDLEPSPVPWTFEGRGTPIDAATFEHYDEWLAVTRERRAAALGDQRRHGKQPDEGLVQAAITAAKAARRISPHVLLWIPPSNPCAPAVAADEALARIERESGARLVRPPTDLTCDDFEDVAHFNRRTGVPKASAALGKELRAVTSPGGDK